MEKSTSLLNRKEGALWCDLADKARQTWPALAAMALLALTPRCVSSRTFGTADIGDSAITTDFAYLFADGQDTAHVTVTLQTDRGTPLPGVQVALSGGNCQVMQAGASADANGQVCGSVTSTQSGACIIQATLQRADYTTQLPEPLVLTFFPTDANQATIAGEPVDVQLLPREGNGSASRVFVGTVAFTSSDAQAMLPEPQSFAAADEGHRLLAGGVTFRTAGAQTLVGRDTATGAQIISLSYRVAAGPAAVIALFPSNPAPVAGTVIGVDAHVQDVYGNDAVDYNGTVALTSTDAQASLPLPYAYTSADAGRHTFSALQLRTAGSRGLTALDTATSIINGEVFVSVQIAPIAAFALTGDGNAVAGVSWQATVAPQDAFGNTVEDFAGTLQLSANDPNATLPAQITVTAGVAASKSFAATFIAAGHQGVRITDTALNIDYNATVSVVGGAFDHLGWSNLPASVQAGASQTILLQAFDVYDNVSSLYRGVVNAASSDPNGALSANTFIFSSTDAGSIGLQAVFKSRGTQVLTATDAVTGVIATASTLVQAGTATQRLALSGVPGTVVAGTGFNVVLQAIDVYGNAQTDYAGTVRLSCSDANAACPNTVIISPMSNGNAQVPVVFNNQGAQTFTATDTNISSITGAVGFTVLAAPAYALVFRQLPASSVQVCRGFPASVIVGAQDAFGNSVPLSGPVTLGLAARQNVAVPPQLAGTLLRTPVAGVAQFNDLSVQQAGTGYVLWAGAAGLQTVRSAPFAAVASAPVVTAAQVGNTNGIVDVTLHAASACPVSYAVAYDANQSGFYLSATRPPGSAIRTNIAAAGSGVDLTWQWDSVADLGGIVVNPLSLRLIVSTLNGNTTTFLHNLTLDNRPGFASGRVLSSQIGSPAQLRTADLNHDGAADIVACDPQSDMTVWFGAGSKTATRSGSGSIAISNAVAFDLGDLNRDGLLDVVAATPSGASVQVALGLNGNTWSAPLALNLGNAPVDVAVADINQDGLSDVVVANGTPSNTLGWAYGGGNGQVGAVQSTPTTADPTRLALADLNHDSWPDAVLLSPGNAAVNVMLGSAAGFNASLPTLTTGPAPVGLALGNVNDLGSIDLVVAYNASIDWFPGNRDGTFAAALNFAATSGTTSVQLHDVTRDGVIDAVLSGSSAGWSYLPGRRHAGFDDALSIAGESNASATAVADVDHDGLVDLVGAGTDGNLFVASGTTPASLRHGPIAGISTNTAQDIDFIEAGDYNEDGFMDMLVLSISTQNRNVYLGDGSGAVQAHGAAPLNAAPAGVLVADINSDGHLDFAVTSLGNGEVDIYLGSGDANFALTTSIFLGSSAGAINRVDFNEDGKIDLAVAMPQIAQVATLLGDGRGGFTPGARADTDLGPEGVVSGDINNDGHADLVTVNAAFDTVSSMQGDGNGHFAAPVTTGSYLCGERIFLRDANRDGKLDLYMNCDGVTYVQAGDGVGGFANTLGATEGGWNTLDLDVADVNQDGLPDIMMPAVVSIFSVDNGSGGLTSTGAFAPNLSPGRLADMDGDGIPDGIGVSTYRRISTMFNPGNASMPTPSVVNDSANNPQNLVHVDLDGDGYEDLISANQGDGGASPPSITNLRVMYNQRDGTFATNLVLSLPPNYFDSGQLAAGDVNHDGWPEIFLADQGENQVFWWMATGSGAYNPNAQALALNSPQSIQVHDINGDGNRDLVVDGPQQGVYVATGNGDGTFGAFAALLPGSGSGWFALGDLDHNGADDIVATFDGYAGVQLLDTSGQPMGAPLTATSPPANGGIVNLGDFNLDGTLDLLVSVGAAINGFAVALGNGDGTFGAFVITGIDPSMNETWVHGMVVGDLNADGNPDVGLSMDSSAFLFYPAISPGVLGLPSNHTTSNNNAGGCVIGQFNNDGYPDIGIVNFGYAENLTVFLGR